MTTGPVKPCGSSQSAADGGGAGRLHDQLLALDERDEGARQRLLGDGEHVVDVLPHQAEGQRTRLADRDAVGHRRHVRQPDRAPLGERRRVRGRPGCLDADHAHVRTQRLDGDRDTGDQAAATRGYDDGGGVGHLLDDLEPEGALAGDDVAVVERVDEHCPGLLGELRRRGQAVLEHARREPDVGAVAAGSPLLRDRRAVGHEDGGRDAVLLRGQRDALRVVAGRGRHDAEGTLLVGEPGDPDGGAADLERAGALEVLALEVHRHPGERGEPPRLHHRCPDGDGVDQRARGLDVGKGDGGFRHDSPRLVGG